MHRRTLLLLALALSILVALTACQDDKQPSSTPADVTEQFFAAFAASDYKVMEAYCTEECITSYFHDDDVNGFVWAKLVTAGEAEPADDHSTSIFVTVEAETAPSSSLQLSTEGKTSFYVHLIQNEDGQWLIDRFTTG